MSMNIGNLMRALIGDGQPTDVRAMELRIGQIVRGVLVEMLENNEALIQINGVQVRAQLDAALPVGKGTLLQVAQESTAGSIVLKTLADLTTAPPDEALKDVAKSFGLPDQKWSFELMKGLKRDGYPIDKDTANWFKQAAQAKPPGEEMQNWMNAAGVAFRRGLDPTETTIASLKTTLFGPPLGEQMDKLGSLLADFLEKGAADGAKAGGSSQAQEAAKQLQQLLSRGQQLLSEGARQLADGAGARAEEAATDSAASGRSAQTGGAASAGGLLGERAAPAQQGQAAGGGAGSAVPSEGRAAVSGQPASGAEPTKADGGRLSQPQDARGEAARAMAGTTVERARADSDSVVVRDRLGGGSIASGNLQQPVSDRGLPEANSGTGKAGSDGAWIGRFLEWLGTGHERQAAQMHSGDAMARQLLEGAGGKADEAASAPAESLKSALLALASADDAPPALREAAQGMAQQITGQQLLLSAERQNTAMMSHMTVFVPIKGQNGDTTATIHIQTRRGRKGEWDSDNCRLVFQLNMSHIGDTLVDVQVIDRVVSLRVLNDRPWVSELLEAARDEAAQGLQEAGYQLLTLKTAAFPAVPAGEAENAEKNASVFGSSFQEQAATAYAAKPYKGVDYRA